MTIAEFFVKIGVSGSDKAKKDLGGIGEGLGLLTTKAFVAYQAIEKMLYGLKSLAEHSLQTGTSLQQFASNTGMSVEMLQRYQYAAGQSGVKNEQFQASIMSLQHKLMAMSQLGEGAFVGYGEFMAKVGASREDLSKPFVMLEKFQQLATKMRNDPVKFNYYMNNAGIDPATSAAIWDQQFTKANLSRAKVLSSGDSKGLRDAHAGINNIGRDMDVALGKIFAEFGPKLIPQIGTLVAELVKLAEAFAMLARDTDFIEKLSGILGTMVETVKTLVGLFNLFAGASSGNDAQGMKGAQQIEKSMDKFKKNWNEKTKSELDLENLINAPRDNFNAVPNAPLIQDKGKSGPVNNIKMDFNINANPNSPTSMINDIKRAVEDTIINISSQNQVV